MIGVDRATKRGWRPQGFGRRSANDIDDPIVEPLWTGLRVLVHVEDSVTTIVDRDGGHLRLPDLAAAVSGAARAQSTVLDGYLTGDALRGGVGAIDVTLDNVPTAAQRARHLFMGRLGERSDEVADLLSDHVRAGRIPDGPVALVVVDVLEVDGQPLLDVPLLERKRQLDSIVDEAELVRIGTHVRPPLRGWIMTWKSMGFRSMAFKDANSRYRPGAVSDGWAMAPMPKR
jgi:bifunctional non-homologous end joining protein LigD